MRDRDPARRRPADSAVRRAEQRARARRAARASARDELYVLPLGEPNSPRLRAKRLETPVGALRGIGPMSWPEAHTIWTDLDRSRAFHRAWPVVVGATEFDELVDRRWRRPEVHEEIARQVASLDGATLGDVLGDVQAAGGHSLDTIERRLSVFLADAWHPPAEVVWQPWAGTGEARVVLFDGPLHHLPTALLHGTELAWQPWQIGLLWAAWHHRVGARPVTLADRSVELLVDRRPGGWGEAIALAAQQHLYCADEPEGPEDALRQVISRRSWRFWWNAGGNP